ncbi:DUF3016 domain-containing protein [Metapseudomonas lalkuanensis]|uniref:DUF3016 domain-containing protein n=1 Tax=Metapseudomonas lalkuanensis TaxID=2604832 RepID=UPI001CF2497F|nr:DUF3016 domain-containing protein [Pseudomonas lalkuanensis]UCO97300.1 DUF3016 domain-containing protein [Pseudomonas lalkuanensis]
MRPTLPLIVLALVILSPTALASSTEVSFSHPDTYSDARLYRDYGRGADDFVLKDLKAHIEKLGKRYLQPGQTLKVDILDIDLAGQYEPWRVNFQGVRFMREVTWPRIKLHYSLEQDGRVLVSRDATVIDQSYLQHGNYYFSNDRLRYEKTMLDDWFRWNIGPKDKTVSY